MVDRLAVEDVEPEHWVAWVLDLPGCFSSASTQTETLASASERISDYYSWLTQHDPSSPMPSGPFDLEVVETFHSFACSKDPEYLVNAFFEDDHRPLTYGEVDMVLRLLRWIRQDFMSVLGATPPGQLNKPIAGELRGSILGIVEHIAGAENWYFDQLDLGMKRAELPQDPMERLHSVRANTRSQLVKLIGMEEVTENCDELWSARKVVRRTLWHERDHTQQIARLLTEL